MCIDAVFSRMVLSMIVAVFDTTLQILPNAVISEENVPQALENEEYSHLYQMYPVVKGEIKDFDGLEAVIRHVLYHHCGWVEGCEEHVVMVEPVMLSRIDRERLAQILFENFNVNSYFVSDAAVSSLYSVGKTSGIVVDVGYEKTDISAVADGMTQPSSSYRLHMGGRQMTERLKTLLREKGVDISVQEAEAMKIGASKKAVLDQNVQDRYVYELPDGERIHVQEEFDSIRQDMLDPSRVGLDCPPLSDICTTAGMVTTLQGEKEMRKSLIENIFVCGGGSGFPQLAENLLSRVSQTCHSSLSPGLCRPAEYMPSQTTHRAAWMGGSVLGKYIHHTQGNTAVQAVTKAEYHEYGPKIIHKRCT